MGKPDNTRLNQEMWDSRARTYDRYFGFARWSQRKLVSFLELKDDVRLLDLACGTGWAVLYAASLMNGRGQFYGIDISSSMVQKAETNSRDQKNVHFRRANVEALPFDTDSFDHVICSNAFHHFSDPDQAVREAHRVLRPRGRIYILDVTADSFAIRLLDRLSRRLERGHVRIYSTQQYRALFQRAGLLYVRGKSIMPSWKIHVGQK